MESQCGEVALGPLQGCFMVASLGCPWQAEPVCQRCPSMVQACGEGLVLMGVDVGAH